MKVQLYEANRYKTKGAELFKDKRRHTGNEQRPCLSQGRCFSHVHVLAKNTENITFQKLFLFICTLSNTHVRS